MYFVILTMTYSFIYATNLCAGTINLQSQLSVTIKDKTMNICLNLSNKGQASAYDIIARIVFLGKTKKSKTIPCLKQDVVKTISMVFDLQKNMKGDYPLIVEIKFHDNNLYPFYSLRCAPVHIQSQKLDPKLTVQVPDVALSEQNRIDVHISNPDILSKDLTVQMIVPGSFTCENNLQHQLLPKGQSINMAYSLLKKIALPGSNHYGYVLITYNENAMDYAQISSFRIYVKPDASICFLQKKDVAHIWFGFFLIWIFFMTYLTGRISKKG